MTRRKLTEIIDELIRQRDTAGEQWSTKQVEDDARAAWDRGEAIDDPVAARIHDLVKARDKASRQQADDTLDFGDWAFPRSLVIGTNERQPARTALLKHVMADQLVKQANKTSQDNAWSRYQNGILAALPYLQQGLTLAAAKAAYDRDNPAAAGGSKEQ